jgi:hypothetical protein
MRGLPIDVPVRGPTRARFVDPTSMEDQKAGEVEPSADGTWKPDEAPTFADWVLVIARGERPTRAD